MQQLLLSAACLEMYASNDGTGETYSQTSRVNSCSVLNGAETFQCQMAEVKANLQSVEGHPTF